MPASSSRQLAAILFTDIVGYTGIMQADEQQAVSLIKHYHTVLERWVKQFNGHVANFYGDGSLCIFTSATHAVQCAIEIQKELRTEPAVPLRIGLHIGEVIFEDGKAMGDGVNIASRIQSLGQKNTILLSAEMHDKIKNNPAITAQSLGAFSFKNVQKPMEVFALSNDGLWVPTRKSLSGKLETKNKPLRNALIGVLLLLALFGSLRIRKIFFSSPATAIADKSIAVLPFTDMSAQKDQEYFSDGLTEDIIAQLAKIHAFKVTSRTSVMAYKNNTKSIKAIGHELGTGHILEGSVQHEGNKVRITAQLINVATDEHLWTDTYDRTMEDIFAIQSDIANQIAHALQAKLSPAEKQLIEKKYTDNTAAYQLYLQGRFYWNQRYEEPVKKSITFFKEAIGLDSTYALAYAGLGDAYLMLGVYNVLPPAEGFPLAKFYAREALRIDPSLAEAYATLIDISIHYDWDPAAAETYFQKTIQLNPLYANAYHWHSEVYDLQHEFDKAIQESLLALRNDPYALILNTQLAMSYIYAGRYDDAVMQLQKTIAFDSTFAISHYDLGIAYIGQKKWKAALLHLQKAHDLAPDRMNILSTLGFALAGQGNQKEALQIEKEMVEQAKQNSVPAYDLAVIEMAVGDPVKALQYLGEAYTNREPWMPFIGMNPLFEPLQNNPRFQHLVQRIQAGGHD